MCLMVSKPSVSNRVSGSTRLGHDMRQYRSFFKNEPLTFRVEAPPRSRSILGSTQKDARKRELKLLALWVVGFCVCAEWSLPLCCWAFGRLWCLVLFCFFCRLVVAPCRLALSVWALPLALCFLFFLKKKRGRRPKETICRAASPELPFSGKPLAMKLGSQVVSAGLLVTVRLLYWSLGWP